MEKAHPFVTTDRETLARNWFPIANPLDQAISNYCVLMLTCAVKFVRGAGKDDASRSTSFTALDQLCLARTYYAIPMIVSVTVREEDLPSPDCAWGAA